MQESSTGEAFLSTWHQVMFIGTILFSIIAIIIYIYHKVRVSGIKGFKDKYDYLRKHEIRTYQICFISLGIALGCLINTYGRGTISFDWIWFSVRLFMGIAGGTLVGYVIALVLKYYYPTRLNKKLRKWRYMPRINHVTGNKMRLLSEDEEDVHLDEGMQAEEKVFSVDYDVWVDDQTKEIKIEKYPGHLVALQCNNCGFYTMKVIREQIVIPPTETTEGELIKHYECQYCGSVRATQFNIAKITSGAEDLQRTLTKTGSNAEVELVNVEIINAEGHKRTYNFQSVIQAQKFLREYNAEEVS
ncbi:hypothetical protein [Fulvivirga sediminis]|nr:hypothetical protein [Fulvivirga sediminis]